MLPVPYPRMGKQLLMFSKSKGTQLYRHSHYKAFTQTSVAVCTSLLAHIKKKHDETTQYLFKLIFKLHINRRASLQPGIKPATAQMHYQSGNPFTTTVTALLPVHWITYMVLCDTVPAPRNTYHIFMHHTYHVWPALEKPHLRDEGVQKQWVAGVHSQHYCVYQTQSCWTSVALFL